MKLLGINDPPAAFADRALELHGKHVHLAPLSREHAPEVQVWVDKDEPGFYNSLASPVDFDHSALRFFDWLIDRAGDDILPFAVLSASTGEVVGYTRYLHIEPKLRTLEIGGTWYAPPFRGTQVNPECKLLLLRHVFEVAGFNRVQIQTDINNIRSQRAIEKIGATFEGVLRSTHQRRDGTVRDTWVASAIRTDWPRIEDHLLSLIDRSARFQTSQGSK